MTTTTDTTDAAARAAAGLVFDLMQGKTPAGWDPYSRRLLYCAIDPEVLRAMRGLAEEDGNVFDAGEIDGYLRPIDATPRGPVKVPTGPDGQYAVGDSVRVRDYCHGCRRDHARFGTVIGWVPASDKFDPSGQVDPFAAMELRYVVQTGMKREVHELLTAAALFPASRWAAPFCAWCGETQRADDFDDETECQEFYREHGRPMTRADSDDGWDAA